jgi:hypothetical protein
VPPEIRQLIVRQLGLALADAWRKKHPINDERPETLAASAGRDVRGSGGREQHDSITHRRWAI